MKLIAWIVLFAVLGIAIAACWLLGRMFRALRGSYE